MGITLSLAAPIHAALIHVGSQLSRVSCVVLKELFVQHLAQSSFHNGSGKETHSLSYSDLAHTAEETETFHFLTGETRNPDGPAGVSAARGVGH